jgi:hypothetical protein
MNARRIPAVILLALASGYFAAGCGEKIAVPEPEGLFSVAAYLPDGEPLLVADAEAVLSNQGSVLLLQSTRLALLNQALVEIDAVEGFTDARAMCVDDDRALVFVWDQDAQTMTWYQTLDLEPPTGVPGSTTLPEVTSCTGLATSRAGVELAEGATTFLYLADHEAGVIRRYAYDPFTGLLPFGILCNDQGSGTRVVRSAAGMARDASDSLLVCEIDPERHWVMRFSSVPDLTDTTSTGEELWRGFPALFDEATGNPPPPADYVLGDAPEAGESGWQGGPSSELGAFDRPMGVTVDGSGRIFVADRGNDRIQIFDAAGTYELAFGDSTLMREPLDLAVIDVTYDPPAIDYGAYLLVLMEGELRKFISGEHYDHVNEDPPPQD